jgi:hypothetical protein
MNKPTMVDANSSMLSQHGYDPATRTLHVIIGPDKHYTHANFSQDDYRKLVAAESRGKHYNTMIRGKFPHTGPHK